MGFGVQGAGFRVQGAGFRVQGSGFRVQRAGFRVQSSRSRVQGSGFRVQGSGFRVQGPGFRVQGAGSTSALSSATRGPSSGPPNDPDHGIDGTCRVETFHLSFDIQYVFFNTVVSIFIMRYGIEHEEEGPSSGPRKEPGHAFDSSFFLAECVFKVVL